MDSMTQDRWVLASTGNLYQLVLGKTTMSPADLSIAMASHEGIELRECRYFQYATGQAQDPNGQVVQLFNHQLLPFPMSHQGGIITLVATVIIEVEQSESLRDQVAAMLKGIEQMETEIRSKKSGLVVAPLGLRSRS